MITLENLLIACTLGRWTVSPPAPGREGLPVLQVGGLDLATIKNVTRRGSECHANALYLAHAANVLPVLVQALKRAEATIQAVRSDGPDWMLDGLEPDHREVINALATANLAQGDL